MPEINLGALTNVKAKLEEDWAWEFSEVTEAAKAPLCQLNCGVLRLGSWRGIAVVE